MKLILSLILLICEFAMAAPKDNLMNDCVMSYLPSSSNIFDAAKIEINSETHMVFRSRKYADTERIYIYSNGKYWFAPIPVKDNFFAPKTAIVQLGDKTYCMDYDLNWILNDEFHLLKADDPKCAGAPKMVMKTEEVPAPAEKSLRDKIVHDLDYQMSCFDPKEECTANMKETAYNTLKNWNSSVCEKIKDPVLQSKIKDVKKVVAGYGVQSPVPASSGASVPGQTPAQSRQPVNH
ncbi:MAG: hypothetical protein ACXVAX_01170 [Pseudobdellovibrio sp.]